MRDSDIRVPNGRPVAVAVSRARRVAGTPVPIGTVHIHMEASLVITRKECVLATRQLSRVGIRPAYRRAEKIAGRAITTTTVGAAANAEVTPTISTAASATTTNRVSIPTIDVFAIAMMHSLLRAAVTPAKQTEAGGLAWNDKFSVPGGCCAAISQSLRREYEAEPSLSAGGPGAQQPHALGATPALPPVVYSRRQWVGHKHGENGSAAGFDTRRDTRAAFGRPCRLRGGPAPGRPRGSTRRAVGRALLAVGGPRALDDHLVLGLRRRRATARDVVPG